MGGRKGETLSWDGVEFGGGIKGLDKGDVRRLCGEKVEKGP